ncbi:uncharacterized protein LOC143367833 [Andrena cerasifolii]|uniref:uncharacterized protein LOC143367833 n=1 Tax=Andrena cerasifolii TaxID=2819439 RepID=UPI00403823A3
MVKAMLEGNKELTPKSVLHSPKDGFIQKKKNQKFKQTPTGKVTLINGSKTANNSSPKQENVERQQSTTPPKSHGKNKEHKTKGPSKAEKKQQRSSKNEPKEKDIKSEEDESESDEDINEGIVLEEQNFVQESNDSEDEDESDDDESEEGKNVPNILGHSLADDSDEDDDDYEEEEDEKEQIQEKKGVQKFKGLKPNAKNSSSTEDSANVEDSTSDDDDEEEDIDNDSDEDIESEDDDEEESDDDEDSEDEEGGDRSILGLKALLGSSIADDDDDEDFIEPGEEDDDEVSDEEEDEEEEEEEEMNNSSLNSTRQSKTDQEDAPLEELKMDRKTVFVGNLPKEVTKKQLKKEFKKFGHIETIRLRGIVAKSMKVSKKVAAITKELHSRLKSVYAYIRFDSEAFATAALSMNGIEFQGNCLRVDTACKSNGKPNLKKSVFLGNLNFNIDDSTVRKHFNGCGEIESIRIIRDNKTGVGKGFGYVNFKTEDAAALALELDSTMIANREVRVKPCTKQDKKKKGKHGKRSLSTEDRRNDSPKKLKNNAEVAVGVRNRDNAVQRITGKKQKFEKQSSPQQAGAFQGQKTDGHKKKGKNKLEKKKKIMAEKLAAKPKKPIN